MYYSSFGILAVIHHMILNYNALRKDKGEHSDKARYHYRLFLNALLVFYVADLSWGFLVESGIRFLAYADTWLFFATMALSVLLWTRYVVAFLDKKGIRSKSFLAAGWGIFAFVGLLLIVNFFYPIVFTFTDDTIYVPYFGRYILLVIQLLLFILISVYSLFVSLRSEGRDKVHYMAVFASGGVMAILIILQTMYPFAPFYTIGCMIANCVVHIFVEEDEKKEKDILTENARRDKERYSQISLSLAMDYEGIYYINIEDGKYMEISSDKSLNIMKIPKSGEDFYKAVGESIRQTVHPDDRMFAKSMYLPVTIKKSLEGRKSYSYQYRIMIGDEARYFRFQVILSEDEEHFVLCLKDIHDTITAEKALFEDQKTSVTFSQIAESLAFNYDVIYYVDLISGAYVGYTANNIYGELKVDDSGKDFFGEARKNIALLIHPQDRERMFTVLDKDYLITALEDRRQFVYRYRHIVNDKVQHTRLTARKSSDGIHIIIGVENIEAEVRKEKEHINALNTEKELARRDELTGVRNKMAFTELEHSLQEELDNGLNNTPFAIAVCDLNNLKMINDTKGHKAGDEYIVSSANLLCDIFDHSPVFRIGGDEFAVFLSGQDYDSRKKLIENLHNIALKNRDRHEGPIIAAGIAEYDPAGDLDIDGIFERADKMMYEDKRELKNA